MERKKNFLATAADHGPRSIAQKFQQHSFDFYQSGTCSDLSPLGSSSTIGEVILLLGCPDFSRTLNSVCLRSNGSDQDREEMPKQCTSRNRIRAKRGRRTKILIGGDSLPSSFCAWYPIPIGCDRRSEKPIEVKSH